jgi:hypothetical protein
MLQKVYVKNLNTDTVYIGYYSDNNPFKTPFFTKETMRAIIEETNVINRQHRCDVIFFYDKKEDKVFCEDNEFHKGVRNGYNSHMMYTPFGMMKLYHFGDEILWEQVAMI